jgi:hypothetical protein
MSAAVLEAPRAAAGAYCREATRPVRAAVAPGRRQSLDAVIGSAWAGLTSQHPVACPVCGGRMTPRYGASGAEPVGGRCGDCGSALA